MQGKWEKLIEANDFYFMKFDFANNDEFFLFDIGNDAIIVRNDILKNTNETPTDEIIADIVINSTPDAGLNDEYANSVSLKRIHLPDFTYRSADFKKGIW